MDEGHTAPPAETLEAQLLKAIKHCWSAIFSSAVRRTLPGHLTPQQLFVLGHLGRGACQPSALARESHVGMSAMTGLVDGLVARGLVARGQNQHDRRAVQLELTDAGRTLCREAQAAVLEETGQLLAPLTAEQRERLALALGDLSHALAITSERAGPAGERAPSGEDEGAAALRSASRNHWN
jgi:DNA-binding MarR family transcriptional regulator